MKTAAVLFFCWTYTGAPPPSPSPYKPDNCFLGAWLDPKTIIMPGTYTNEDAPLRRHWPRGH